MNNIFMYPLTVIRIAKGCCIDVELKTGVIYTGTLYKCDLWMNIVLRNATKDRKDIYKETYIKGSAIKSVCCEKRHLQKQELLQRSRGNKVS